MSTSSSTDLPKAPPPTTTTSTTTPNNMNPSSPTSSSSPSPSPRWLTNSHSQSPSQPSSPSTATSPAAATASPPTLSPTLPTPQTTRHVSDARAAVVASIGNMLDSELQSRAAILHANAAALERQERDVVRATDGLRRETQKLKAEADKAARKVKELGNVQNWAEVLERGFLVLEETVRGDEGSDEEEDEEERLGGEGVGVRVGDDDDGGKGSGKGVKSFENDAVRKLRTMDLNGMSEASRSLMSILEASSSTGRAKSSGTTMSTG
ncbi:hypothetical protein TgHK011_006313 [Trichoderma gracile]|nr:hypothetical protein TgHK011_006313 [Trichoderma gracile]